MVKAKFWALKKYFDGKPKQSDFELVEEELPDKLQKGGKEICPMVELLERNLLTCVKRVTGDKTSSGDNVKFKTTRTLEQSRVTIGAREGRVVATHPPCSPKLNTCLTNCNCLVDVYPYQEILCEALHLTVDPYMRPRDKNIELGKCMMGESISKVIISENPDYPVGTIVRPYSGWRSHIHIKDPLGEGRHGLPAVGRMPEMGELSKSLALGVMGMPGMTAYFGFLEICQPKEGETVLVNGAAGAVGSLVGQIAKIKGCKVIGFAGNDEKCKWVKDALGFDEVFNYKKVNLDEAIKKAAPEGVDCFFDNVGSDFTSTVLKHMKLFGRVSVCGQISAYNAKEPPTGPYPFSTILIKQLKIEGFTVSRWLPKWPEGEKDMFQWIKEGKIKYRETITKGFENMPQAFIGLFEGENTGKAIINA